jgi:hypothetical protein
MAITEPKMIPADGFLELCDGLVVQALFAVRKAEAEMTVGLSRRNPQDLLKLFFRVPVALGVQIGLSQCIAVDGIRIEADGLFILGFRLRVTLQAEQGVAQGEEGSVVVRIELGRLPVGFDGLVRIPELEIGLAHVIGRSRRIGRLGRQADGPLELLDGPCIVLFHEEIDAVGEGRVGQRFQLLGLAGHRGEYIRRGSPDLHSDPPVSH